MPLSTSGKLTTFNLNERVLKYLENTLSSANHWLYTVSGTCASVPVGVVRSPGMYSVTSLKRDDRLRNRHPVDDETTTPAPKHDGCGINSGRKGDPTVFFPTKRKTKRRRKFGLKKNPRQTGDILSTPLDRWKLSSKCEHADIRSITANKSRI